MDSKLEDHRIYFGPLLPPAIPCAIRLNEGLSAAYIGLIVGAEGVYG